MVKAAPVTPLMPYNLSEQNKARVNEILDVIIAYAKLDFAKKTNVIGNNDVLDAIGAGVNMLGEELETSTISLREKEQLLKEIHHRVKNNLQIVSSLLNLQTENVTDPRFLEMIADSRSRIYSMSLVHEMLYSSADLSRIELGEYIRHLCACIQSCYSRPNSEILIHMDIAPSLHFDIDRMIPVGLIINEIISNSFKYAFPQNRGEIHVKIGIQQRKVVLEISDDGVGFRPGTDSGGHLGLQLIEMLSEQMDASLSVDQSTGTRYRIAF
jgi:two-component sensor histidine kinase